MNDVEILIERRKSLESKKNTKNSLNEDQQKLKFEKISRTFELSMLARERRDILSQINISLKLKEELSSKKIILERLIDNNKLNLKIYKAHFISLEEEIESLTLSLNDFSHENHLLAELFDRISSEVTEKRLRKEDFSSKVLGLEKELLRKQELFRELNNSLQDTTRKLDDLLTGKKLRLKELEDLNQGLLETTSSLQLKKVDLEKVQMDFDLVEKERNNKKNQIENLRMQLDGVLEKLEDNKTKIGNIQNELIDLSEKNIKSSNEFEKLKELEMLTSLTLDHVQKEDIELKKRIEKTNEKILVSRCRETIC